MRMIRFGALAALFLSVSASIAYFSITKYDIYDRATGGRTGDVAWYVRMSQGEDLESVPKPYRYRVLTPWLARLVPFLPDSITQFYEITPEKVMAFKFGIVNLLGITVTGLGLFLLLRRMAFSDHESLVGALLFYTSFYVVNYATVPLVDAWAYAFLTLGILAILHGRNTLLCLLFAIGMFAKETTLLVLLCAILLKASRRVMAVRIALCLPGLLGYAVFRLVMFPTDSGYSYSVAGALSGLTRALVPGKIHIYTLIDVALTYGVLWLIGGHGWAIARHLKDHPIQRLRWLIPIVAVVPFLIGSNVGRIWFLSFPAMLPLSLLGLRALTAMHGGAGAGGDELARGRA